MQERIGSRVRAVRGLLLGMLLASNAVAAEEWVPSPSTATFYGEPAAWLFDLVKEPTSIRHFELFVNGQKVAATQIRWNDIIQCTLHGKTLTPPTSSSEAQLALCEITAENINVIFPPKGGHISFVGPTADSLFELLPNIGHVSHSTDFMETNTMKYFGEAGSHGITCYQNLPDDPRLSLSTTCSISWRENNAVEPGSVGLVP